MTQEESPRKIDKKQVRALAAIVEGKLRGQLASLAQTLTLSAETKKGIVKRVTPKLVAKFSKAEMLPTLIALELEMLGDRIRLYPFTAQYREAINSAPRDMLVAWQLHSHSLRQGELYIIQERSVELLKFLREVATNLGIPSPDRSKFLERAFKKRFAYRLRERHRLVHAHERPSLTSRMVDFAIAAEETDKDMVVAVLADLLAKMAELLPGPSTDDPQESFQRLLALRDSYAAMAHREATHMFEMLTDEVGMTLGILIQPPSKLLTTSAPDHQAG